MPPDTATASRPSREPIQQVVVRAGDQCVLEKRGRVLCTGDWSLTSADGGSQSQSLTSPMVVEGLPEVDAIALGFNGRGCAVAHDRSVWCWGNNLRRPHGWMGGIAGRLVAARVEGVTDVVELALGSAGSCARRADRSVACWGPYFGWRTHGREPAEGVRTLPLRDVVDIDAGPTRACAVLGNGSLHCWGDDPVPQPDVRPRTPDEVEPMPGVVDAVEAAVGGAHVCIRSKPGAVLCWGSNERGQLGDGTFERRDVFVPVSAISHAKELAAGFDTTCARDDEGAVLCWGDADTSAFPPAREGCKQVFVRGTMGSVPSTRCPVPQRVPFAMRAERITLGTRSVCAQAPGGDVTCWGATRDSSRGRRQTFPL